MENLIYEVIGFVAWLMIGLRFAYRFLQFHMSFKSDAAQMFDCIIASIFILAIWPLMIACKLLRED